MKRLLLLLLLLPFIGLAQTTTVVTKDLDTIYQTKGTVIKNIKVGVLAYKDSIITYDTIIQVFKPYQPPTSTNRPPVARAGADIVFTLPGTVRLDGSLSSDPDNNIKTYGWRKVSGPTATITDSNKAIATLSNLQKGVYVYELRVADQLGLFSADLVTVTVNDPAPPVNQPPTARITASATNITLPTNTINLSAVASTDPDGSIASWLWIKTNGPPVGTIESSAAMETRVSGMTTAGTYTYQLTVTDNGGAKGTATVTITVNPAIVVPPTGQPVPFSFSQIPFSDPDLNAPGRGVEDWHNQNRVNIPTEGTNTQRIDAYYRSQLTWCQLESSQGVYTLNPLISLLNSCISKKQKMSFGIMSVYHDNEPVVISYDGFRSSYPEYLHRLMQQESVKDWHNADGWIPNYNSTHYLTRLKALHVAINNLLETGSFNGVRYKDVIYVIDVRGYGNYGEWHNGGLVDNVSQIPSGARATSATLKAIIDAHTSAFPNFQLCIIMTAFDYFLQHTMTSPEVGYYALTTSNAHGKLGWRRDNWGAGDGTGDTYIDDLLIDNVGTWNGVQLKTLIMQVWKYAPVTGEPMNSTSNSFSELEAQVRKYHATSFGNGNITSSPNAATKTNFRAASKAAGYRLISTGGSFTPGPNSISITNNWQNVGIAPTYEDWNITYELVSSSATTTLGVSSFKLRLFLPASTATEHTDVFQWSPPSGTYMIRMVIKDPAGYRAPLVLALQGKNADGSYNLKATQQ